MNRSFVFFLKLLGVAFLLVNSARLPVGAAEEALTAIAGKGIGSVELGMIRAKVVAALGKPAGDCSTRGARADWFCCPDPMSEVRVYYDAAGRVVQINSSVPAVRTTDSISTKSRLADVKRKYKDLQRFKYRHKDGYIDYYDDVKHGLAFQFAWAAIFGEAGENKEVAKEDTTGASQIHMVAIIVHTPGKRVMAEAGDRSR